MAIRPTRSKIVSTLEKRLGRALSDTETLRLAAYARAVRVRREQHRVYKPRFVPPSSIPTIPPRPRFYVPTFLC